MEQNIIYHNNLINQEPWGMPQNYYPEKYPIIEINRKLSHNNFSHTIYSNLVLNSIDPDHTLIKTVKSYSYEYIKDIITAKHTWTIIAKDPNKLNDKVQEFLDYNPHACCDYHRVLFLEGCLILELYFEY